MPEIRVLDKNTINQIAAGEVVERPSSIVKELCENAIDAGADAVTVEIKNGGIELIRVTDNGCGMNQEEIRTAFMRHATSKIRTAEDLSSISSLGFRGEALSSIASVTRLEVITKTKEALSGSDYEIEGGTEQRLSEIGAPEGTTFLVRDIFYNTPARRKFLKTAMTEASYISDLLEKIALSHPEVSIRFISNGQTRLVTNGNGKVKDLIYTVFGRETANEVTEINYDDGRIAITGFIGKPVLAKGNRGFENYFINGRYVKSNLITKAIEEAYQPFMMQHRYPFTVFYMTLPADEFDVNVHPTKMELRFQKEAEVYDTVVKAVKAALTKKEFIPEVKLSEDKEKEEKLYRAPEPFEMNRREPEKQKVKAENLSSSEKKLPADPKIPPIIPEVPEKKDHEKRAKFVFEPSLFDEPVSEEVEERTASGEPVTKEKTIQTVSPVIREEETYQVTVSEQKKIRESVNTEENDLKEKEVPASKADTVSEVPKDLFETKLISDEGMKKHRLIGQVFDTYWLIELEDKLFILDQHAAHEKVLYERKMKELQERKFTAQQLSPPALVSLTSKEELLLNRYMNEFSILGYEISNYGGREYAVSAVPADLFGLDVKSLFTEILAGMEEEFSEKKPEMILSKLASVSCKAAVKGNHALSFTEAEALLTELLTLENPYACPHGRPTMISMTKKEIEKKFKRIV